jgi:hypothetical protein
MQYIRCTQKLLNELKIKLPNDKKVHFGFIGGWHANLLRFERRKCVLFTNDKTLYSVFVPGLKKPEFYHFDELFRHYLFKSLLNEGFSQPQIERVLSEYQTIVFGKTNNRSVLGSMTDLGFQLEYHIKASGGLSYLDLMALNKQINRIPMKAIDHKYSIDVLGSMLA